MSSGGTLPCPPKPRIFRGVFADLERHLAPNGPMPRVIITMCLNSPTPWKWHPNELQSACDEMALCKGPAKLCAHWQPVPVTRCHTGEHLTGHCVPRQESRSRALAPNTYIFTTAQRLLWKCTCISTPGSIGTHGWREQLPGIGLTGERGSNGM